MLPYQVLNQIGRPPVDPQPFGQTRDGKAQAWRTADGVVYLDAVPSEPYRGRGGAMMPIDDARRVALVRHLACGKHVLDFGCGEGGFVDGIREHAAYALGYEPANEWPGGAFHVITAWHVLEHLDDPVAELRRIRDSLTDDGVLIVEVPHARDWLLTHCAAFRAFSLWSEHRILHTRDSLTALLAAGGFAVERMVGVQRYPWANHVTWLTSGQPGHYETAAGLDREHAAWLAARDETDTLVAWGVKR